MVNTIIKRLLSVIPILLIVSITLFILMNVLPGDAAAGIVSSDMPPEIAEQIREELGLNRPVVIRYLDWMGGIVIGDFGVSLINKQPVIEKIALRLPVTFELTMLSMLIAVLFSLPAGIISAVKRNSLLDVFTSFFSMVGVAMPPFWLGMLLVLFFSVILGCLPASGYVHFSVNPSENLLRMIMPCITVAVALTATIMRQTRSALLDVLDEDYIVTAKAKGLTKLVVVVRHALRNALIPVITVIAMQVGRFFAGAVIAETVFALPGIGREIVDGILSRDYPVVMGMVLIVAIIIVFINTLVDIFYIILDPRISIENKR